MSKLQITVDTYEYMSDLWRWDNRYKVPGPFLYSLISWRILRKWKYIGYGGIGKNENGINEDISQNIIKYHNREGLGYKKHIIF